MYQLAISRTFIARHFLVGGDWGKENDRHSHQYRVEVLLEAEDLDEHGYLVDIVHLEAALTKVIESFADNTLNDLDEFRGINPSLEHFARIFWQALHDKLSLKTKMVIKLWENETDWAAYSP